MKADHCMLRCGAVGLMLGLSVLLAGCATQPSSRAHPSYQLSDLEGTWSWTQDPWHGDFVLKRDGDSCTGTLDDVYEGTYGDKISDVTISGDSIKFTRNGQFGIQQWEGTLKKDHGVLKIVDGRWTKGRGLFGEFHAEKKK